jgi:hypothetical protein
MRWVRSYAEKRRIKSLEMVGVVRENALSLFCRSPLEYSLASVSMAAWPAAGDGSRGLDDEVPEVGEAGTTF